MNNINQAATILDRVETLTGHRSSSKRKVAIGAEEFAYVRFLSVVLSKPMDNVVGMLTSEGR